MNRYSRSMMKCGLLQVSVVVLIIISGIAMAIHQPKTPKIDEEPLGLKMVKISGEDEVYTHTYNEWKIEIIIFNPNELVYNDIVIITTLPAEIDCQEYEISHGILEITKNGKGKSGSRELHWWIDTLEDNEQATCILTLYTLKNPAKKQEFTSPGEYVIIEGTLLIYNEASTGKYLSIDPTSTQTVNAVEKKELSEEPEEPSEPEVPEEPEEPVEPEVPEEPEEPEVPEDPEEPDESVKENLKLEIIKVLGDDEVFTHGYYEWEIEIVITNLGEKEYHEIAVFATLPAEIECIGYLFPHGILEIKQHGEGKSGAKEVSWKVETIKVDEKITLSLLLCTTKNPAGLQEFTSAGEYKIIKDSYLTCNGQSIGPIDPLVVNAKDKEEPGKSEPPDVSLAPPKIDVLFLLDSTGSMGDEIQVVKAEIEKIMFEVQNGTPKPIVRFAIVTYRDRGDMYITKTFDFSYNIGKIKIFLNNIMACGGGDGPESVNEGLHVAINNCSWGNDDSIKMIFLIGDAPPHMDYPDDYDYRDEILIAKEKQIKIHTIGCSGITRYTNGVSIFREIAKKTNGTYQELIYSSGGGGYSGGSSRTKYYTPVDGNYTYKSIPYPKIKIPGLIRFDDFDMDYITFDCEGVSSTDSYYSTSVKSHSSSPSSGVTTKGSRGNSNFLDVQLTYVIQQEAIKNGVSYGNAVSLPGE